MRIVSWLFAILMLFVLVGCDDEHILTGAGDQPTLSTDTLQMGQLLENNSSRTYLLKLYNHCDGELKITSISLRHAAESGYRLNVDGMNGTSFTNSDLLRIAQGDSMFIFVEATFGADPNGALQSQHTDYIDIVCNRKTQTIVLDATSRKIEQHRKLIIDKNTEWTNAQLDKQILDSLIIRRGATLTIRPGVTLYLHDKAGIRVEGTLLCLGEIGKPVTIRGDRTDKMFTNLYYDNLPAQWGSLHIDSTAQGCRFVQTDIHGMTSGIEVDTTDVRFEGCTLRNSDKNLLTFRRSVATLVNCELSNAAGALIEIMGGRYDIVHCTLANYNFSKKITKPSLCLSNMDTEQERPTPLYQCNLLNTIVWLCPPKDDSKDDFKDNLPGVQLQYTKIVTGKNAQGRMLYADSIFHYRFDHCLLYAKGEDDNDFISTLWNEDPKFRTTEKSQYTFDFHLQTSSLAIGSGAAEGTLRCPVNANNDPIDKEGKMRGAIPTIGCYE